MATKKSTADLDPRKLTLEPMLARAGRKIFDDPEWSFELKYSGFRALLLLDKSGARFVSERGSNLANRLPELEEIGRGLKGQPLVLDGEIVAGSGSFASFRDLRHRYAKFGITELRPKEKVAIKYVASDVLMLQGRSLLETPLAQRQTQLRRLVAQSSKGLMRAKSVTARGSDLFVLAKSLGFEGIVAKRLDSVYEPGKRSKNWLHFKTGVADEQAPLPRNAFNNVTSIRKR